MCSNLFENFWDDLCLVISYLGVDLLRNLIRSFIWIFCDSSYLFNDSTYFLKGESFIFINEDIAVT